MEQVKKQPHQMLFREFMAKAKEGIESGQFVVTTPKVKRKERPYLELENKAGARLWTVWMDGDAQSALMHLIYEMHQDYVLRAGKDGRLVKAVEDGFLTYSEAFNMYQGYQKQNFINHEIRDISIDSGNDVM